MMREQTLIPCFTSRFSFVELTSGRMPMFTVVEEWHHGYYYLGYFFSSTHFDLVSLMAQNVWRHSSVWFLCMIVTLMPETALIFFRTLAFFFATGNRYLFLLKRHLTPYDPWSLLPFQFSRVWRQSFVIVISDPYSFSPLSSIFVNWASISSDESSCRTYLKRFWVAQTDVFSICTDFPRLHRMECLTKKVELRPILCRTPEHYRQEE